ncbi:hypothetical protein K2173_017738 [Erythroxylum novogranatense]|uniref:Uncharacterized protein n=1 Tax=Erythroxylum novogranatense TaxID=1862640 RepID=A0AAV8SME1_9ROSI|nr:hypothetical protein K2173_017738 [Erythroxylum novogranatense]
MIALQNGLEQSLVPNSSQEGRARRNVQLAKMLSSTYASKMTASRTNHRNIVGQTSSPRPRPSPLPRHTAVSLPSHADVLIQDPNFTLPAPEDLGCKVMEEDSPDNDLQAASSSTGHDPPITPPRPPDPEFAFTADSLSNAHLFFSFTVTSVVAIPCRRDASSCGPTRTVPGVPTGTPP